MTRARTSVKIVGVGGQGSVFVARVLGEAALRSDIGVVASELHGMAQRGGVVESTVVMGRAHGPIVAPGETDLLIALEPLEALRALPATRRGASAVIGTNPIVPATVSLGGVGYPPLDVVLEKLESWLGRVVALDLSALAESAGEVRANGAVAIGAAAALEVMPISAEVLRDATRDLAPPRSRDVNAAAFDAGFHAARTSREEPS